MRRPSGHITQAQIARKAGISQAAVSAILSGSGLLNVSEETRKSVLSLAEKLGYVARKPAVKGSDAPGKQNVILVERVAPATNEPWVDNVFQVVMGEIFSATGRHLQQYGISLSVFHMEEAQNLTHWLADSNVSGVFWHGPETDSALLHWVASRFPLVLLNREWKTAAPVDSVGIDQERLLLLAAEHLLEMGHRRIAFFGHNGGSISNRRLAAYRALMAERGLRVYSEFQQIPDAVEIPAMTKVEAILDTWKKLGREAPTALIASDVFILPLVREAAKAGIRIPEDLSVIGTNNTSLCSLMEPQITAIDEPFGEMCRAAVELMVRRQANPGESAHSLQIAPRLMKRGSVARLSSGKSAVPSFHP